jgi:hypothetical protein
MPLLFAHKEKVLGPVLKKIPDGVLTVTNFSSYVYSLVAIIDELDPFCVEYGDNDAKKQLVMDALQIMSSRTPYPLKAALTQMIDECAPDIVDCVHNFTDLGYKSLLDFQCGLAYPYERIRTVPVLGTRKLGLARQELDSRDLFLTNSNVKFPLTYVIPKLPVPLDQGDSASCAVNAVVYCLTLVMKPPVWMPSRAYLYWTTRAYISHNSPSQDCGCSLRNVLKALSKYHVPPESLMPYDSDVSKQPSAMAIASAELHCGLKYFSVEPDIVDLKKVLATGFPIVCGFEVTEFFDFESDSVEFGGSKIGDHSIVLVGYDDENFMGVLTWGIKKVFYINTKAVPNENLFDFWTIKAFY